MRVNGTYLILDDRNEDGEPISAVLKERCIPHLFFLADEANLLEKIELNVLPIEKVKVVFQDINLTGAQSPSRKDYDKAVEFLDRILPDDNGPWLMISWSTWSDDEGRTDYPRALFEHLINELPDGKKPLTLKVLDKHQFTLGGAGTHTTVEAYEDMVKERQITLNEEIRSKVDLPVPLSTLLEWELSVSGAVNETLIEIQSIANNHPNLEDAVGKLLYELAKAEAEQAISNETCASALSRILNSQLLSRIPMSIESGSNLSDFDEVELDNFDDWKLRINKFLHFDNVHQEPGPGSLYSYKSFLDSIASFHFVVPPSESASVRHRSEIVGEHLIRKSFKDTIVPKAKASARESVTEILDTSECIVIDVTPPCDFAQNKAEWVKLCAGIIIDTTDKNSELQAIEKSLSNASSFWASCNFSDAIEDRVLRKKVIFNSKIIFTLPSHEVPMAGLKQASVFKLKEQILRTFSQWLSYQLGRAGYTSM
ncbi:MAG: hypothetical protein HWD84_10035 [Flavobacteriaceae bacterium]|nr:hypothetical protein [Flavobacteriaceae bacterium]